MQLFIFMWQSPSKQFRLSLLKALLSGAVQYANDKKNHHCKLMSDSQLSRRKESKCRTPLMCLVTEWLTWGWDSCWLVHGISIKVKQSCNFCCSHFMKIRHKFLIESMFNVEINHITLRKTLFTLSENDTANKWVRNSPRTEVDTYRCSLEQLY